MNLELILDEETDKACRRLSPHLGVFDPNAPRKVSSFLQMPAPVLASIGNYIKHH
jgi:hypothetical protein